MCVKMFHLSVSYNLIKQRSESYCVMNLMPSVPSSLDLHKHYVAFVCTVLLGQCKCELDSDLGISGSNLSNKSGFF